MCVCERCVDCDSLCWCVVCFAVLRANICVAICCFIPWDTHVAWSPVDFDLKGGLANEVPEVAEEVDVVGSKVAFYQYMYPLA